MTERSSPSKNRVGGPGGGAARLDIPEDSANLKVTMQGRSIGAAVKRWRARRDLSQRALAEKAGMQHPVLARLETGQTDPRLSTLARLAKALGVTLPQLFTPPAPRKRPAPRRARR